MTLIPAPSPLPAAVLWDMDGTLIDSEPYWMRAETELVESFGGVWTHSDGLLMVGSGLWNSAAILQGRGVDLDTDTIVQTLTARVQEQLVQHGIPWRPGARELLHELKAAGVPTALVTMSVERMARQVVDLMDFAAFDTIVAGDMVTRSKPDPEAYLLAARTLGVDPAHCVAIEDSLPGVTAAVASGALTIAVPHIIDLPHSADYVRWESLADRGAADITELHLSHVAARAVGTAPALFPSTTVKDALTA
ncbi:MAG: HAD family phosphatase [Cryobacterium sp.]